MEEKNAKNRRNKRFHGCPLPGRDVNMHRRKRKNAMRDDGRSTAVVIRRFAIASQEFDLRFSVSFPLTHGFPLIAL